MGKLFSECPESTQAWIAAQKLFFVATAPQRGHINVSPKGHDTFNLVSPRTCWYLDLTGSGNETISHLSEDGGSRSITLMWAAFDGPPQIVRFWGKGRVIYVDSPEFDRLLPVGSERRLPGARAIIWVDVEAVGTSCGFSMPKLDYKGDRDTLLNFARTKEANDAKGKLAEGMKAYWAQKNSVSIDDLPGPGMRLGEAHPDTPEFNKRIADVSTAPKESMFKPATYHAELALGICVGLVLAHALEYIRMAPIWDVVSYKLV